MDPPDEDLTRSEDIVHQFVYPFPVEKVWNALTDRDKLAKWLMPNDFKPVIGHRFSFREVSASSWSGVVNCQVLEVKYQEKLSFSWQGGTDSLKTKVTFTLKAIPKGTLLLFEHDGFVGEKGKVMKAALDRGWGKKLLTENLLTILGNSN